MMKYATLKDTKISAFIPDENGNISWSDLFSYVEIYGITKSFLDQFLGDSINFNIKDIVAVMKSCDYAKDGKNKDAVLDKCVERIVASNNVSAITNAGIYCYQDKYTDILCKAICSCGTAKDIFHFVKTKEEVNFTILTEKMIETTDSKILFLFADYMNRSNYEPNEENPHTHLVPNYDQNFLKIAKRLCEIGDKKYCKLVANFAPLVSKRIIRKFLKDNDENQEM